MDGSRGATGAVDVGVSHLNMNINVIGGGHGLGSAATTTAVGVQGSSDANTGDSASSSPPVRVRESYSSLARAACSLCPRFTSLVVLSGFSLSLCAWRAVPVCLWLRRSHPYISYQPQSIRRILLLLHTCYPLQLTASVGCIAAMGSPARALARASQRISLMRRA